ACWTSGRVLAGTGVAGPPAAGQGTGIPGQGLFFQTRPARPSLAGWTGCLMAAVAARAATFCSLPARGGGLGWGPQVAAYLARAPAARAPIPAFPRKRG